MGVGVATGLFHRVLHAALVPFPGAKTTPCSLPSPSSSSSPSQFRLLLAMSQSNSASQASGSNSGGGSSSTSVDIPATAPAGGLSITQPPQTATSYYKIAPSQNVTFGWNFTSLYVTPSSLTISAVCENGNTYPVGPTDGIIPGTATEVVWDLWAYNQASPAHPLAVASYTLEIWGDSGKDAVASAGQLSPNDNLRFALYSPASYTPLSSEYLSSSRHFGEICGTC